MIDTIVFDFDGVIIDTETPDYLAWREVFESHGVELDRDLWCSFIGGNSSAFDTHAHLEGLIGTTLDRTELRARRRKRFMELIDAEPVLPGVLNYIESAKASGFKIAIASSSDRAWVEGHLGSRGMLEHFDLIRVKDDVRAVKPDPELYSSAVKMLSKHPSQAVAIEDSAHGTMAAKAAGLFCVLVPNPMTVDLPIDSADIRLDTLSSLPLNELIERLQRGQNAASIA